MENKMTQPSIQDFYSSAKKDGEFVEYCASAVKNGFPLSEEDKTRLQHAVERLDFIDKEISAWLRFCTKTAGEYNW
jgi:hypothetical protein